MMGPAADVFDRFPHGIVVCDPGGQVVAANPRARLDLVAMDAGSVGIASAPLDDDGSHVVVELRPPAARHSVPRRPPRGASAFIECRRGGYAPRRDRVWIDAEAFEHDADEGLDALAAGEHE